MKLTIDIPYEAYYTFKSDLGKGNLNALAEIVANGTPYEERPQCDLISRKFVNEVVCAEVVDLQDGTEKWRSYVNDTCESILEKINNAQPVDLTKNQAYDKGFITAMKLYSRLQGGWIPVSERLPEEEDYRPCYGFEDGCVMWQMDNGDIGFGWYYNSTKCWSDIYDHPIKTGKVIAWQPLPKPYKKGEEE